MKIKMKNQVKALIGQIPAKAAASKHSKDAISSLCISYFSSLYLRKVREDGLSEEAKAAQKAEMERRQRLFSKDKGEQVKFSNIDFLLNGK